MKDETGKRIMQAREAIGMTQRDLAEKMELSESAISKYETGNVKGLSTDRLEEFSKVLSCDTWWLFWGDKPRNELIIDGCEFTEKETEKIREYIEFLKSQR